MKQLDANGLSEEEFLERYDPGDFPHPSVTVDIVVFWCSDTDHGNMAPGEQAGSRHILLIRRGAHPCIGQWALPGGFVNPDETVEEAAKRELMEETGLQLDQTSRLRQLYTFSRPGRDPRTWVITVAYVAIIDGRDMNLQAGDDAADAQWFTIAADSSGNETHLQLVRGDVQLFARVRQVVGSQEFETLENNGLAFDHAEIVTCAFQQLFRAC